jgi:tetratricopeptide (TPR) repeat protein
VKRFEACHVRARRVEGVADGVQEVEGMKRVAAVLRGSGLVQVDEGNRTFGMHQLLQQAVGMQLGWQEQCHRMRQLLQARCGRFGDEVEFDVGLYGVMREISTAAFVAVGRVKEEGNEVGDGWCSGMLLRLYELAREVYGAEAEFPDRVLAAAHGSLKADLEEAEAGVGRSGDGGLVVGGHELRAMRWKLHTLMWDMQSHKSMIEEIGEVYENEAESGGKWQVGVALGAAYHTAGNSYKKLEDSISAHECALRFHLVTLGEQHPATAATLQSMGTTYSDCQESLADQDRAIELHERALKIEEDILGQHPNTAGTMSCLGSAYVKQGNTMKAIELFEKALGIYERTVGRMHRDTALLISNMSTAYLKQGKFDEAEKLAQEALSIRMNVFGTEHQDTIEAQCDLSSIRDIMQHVLRTATGGKPEED